jgi:hypothetical protein
VSNGKPKHEELITQLQSPGWRLKSDGSMPLEGTLEDVARAAHAQKESGAKLGFVQRIENEVELDLFDLEQLWWHLGLPT